LHEIKAKNPIAAPTITALSVFVIFSFILAKSI